MTPSERKILAVLTDDPKTKAEIAELAGIGHSTADNSLRRLHAGGHVRRIGLGRNAPHRQKALTWTRVTWA